MKFTAYSCPRNALYLQLAVRFSILAVTDHHRAVLFRHMFVLEGHRTITTAKLLCVGNEFSAPDYASINECCRETLIYESMSAIIIARYS